MTQQQIDREVALATGESLEYVHRLGFSLADELHPDFDPEPRRPLVFDWDSRSATSWPQW